MAERASSSLDAAAHRLAEAGLSPIPADRDTKRTVGFLLPKDADGNHVWSPYQERIATEAELVRFFTQPTTTALALICGLVSGNLECLDHDAPELFKPWCALVEEMAPGLLGRLVVVQTQSGGYHVIYRCSSVERSRKLAQKPVEREGKPARETLIETKGEGGYFLTAPTEGYTVLQGSLHNIPEITPDERLILLNAAKSFNLAADDHRPAERGVTPTSGNGLRPGDDYNARGNPLPLLEQAGWKVLPRRRGDSLLLRRPGKAEGGCSATWNHIPNRLYVFSTNAYPFAAERAYSPFQIYTLLEHAGDFSAAAAALAAQRLGNNGRAQTVAEKAPDWLPEAPPFPDEAPPDGATEGTDCDPPWPGKVRTGPELLAIRNDLPPDIVQGLCPGRAPAIHYGHGGTGKSYAELHMGVAIARGLPQWLGLGISETRVLLIDRENEPELVGQRLFEIMRADGTGELPDGLAFLADVENNLDSPEIVDELLYHVQQTGAGLLVIDSLSDFWGRWDENSNSDMALAARRLRDICRATGAALIGIHHTPWGDQSKPRGATALHNGVVTSVSMIRDADTLRIKAWKHRRGRELQLAAKMSWVDGAFSLQPLGHPTQQTARSRDPDEQAILDYLEGGEWAPSNEVKEYVMGLTGHARRTVESKITGLVNDQVLERQDQGAGKPFLVRRVAS